MGRRPKPRDEIEVFKSRILDTTLELISKEGYEGFSIRKLGPKLGIAPKTVYNYFRSKDEIYLHVLTRGFDLLYEDLLQSVHLKKDPFRKLEAIARAQARFGFEKPNYYDLMFTWHVPKFNDFRGTDLEPLAFKELQTAMKSFDLLLQTIEQVSDRYGCIKKDEARQYAIQMFAAIHGIVAFKNNTILYYVHEDPDTILDSLLDGILSPLRPHGI